MARLLPLLLLIRVHRSEFISSFDKNSTSLFARSSEVAELDAGVYKALQKPPGLDGISIVTFYAPSCPHCQWFAPHLQIFASHFAKLPFIHFYGMNCECDVVHEDLCVRAQIPDTPTIRTFFRGRRTNETLNDEFSFLVDWIFNISAQLKPGTFSKTARVRIIHEMSEDSKKEKVASLEVDSNRAAHLAAWPEMPTGTGLGLAKWKQQLQENFRFIDRDHDGSLSAGEICAASVWTVGRKVPGEDCAAVVREADEDSSKGLELPELLAVMLQGTIWHRFGSESMDAVHDTSHDGGEVASGGSEAGRTSPRAVAVAAMVAATRLHGGMSSEKGTKDSSKDSSKGSSKDSSGSTVTAHKRLVDAALAILYGLHHGIFLGASTLSAARKSALIAWLLVLHRAFPGPEENREALRLLLEAVTTDPALSSLDGWREYLRGWRFGFGLGASGAQWLQEQHVREYDGLEQSGKVAHLVASVDDYDRPGRAGGACGCAGEDAAVGSSGDVFTCRLWTLFHMLAVCAAKLDGYPAADDDVSTDDSVGKSVVRPQHVMEAIALYVKHFFGCRVCRDHFLLEYRGCEHGRCRITIGDSGGSSGGGDGGGGGGSGGGGGGGGGGGKAGEWKRLSLWLWRAHNDVSIRLAWQRRVRQSHGGSWRVDPFFRSVAWPPPSDCLLCYSFEPSIKIDSGTKRRKGRRATGKPQGWNEEEVHRYIVQSFGPDHTADHAETWFGSDQPQGTGLGLLLRQQQQWVLVLGLMLCFFVTFFVCAKLKVKLRQRTRRRSTSLGGQDAPLSLGLAPSSVDTSRPSSRDGHSLAGSIERCLRFAGRRPRAKTV
jgi:thiol-disulfide isomerase/thioredoxin/uncharacterized membrane protein YgcG